jgi:hypothetical protein
VVLVFVLFRDVLVELGGSGREFYVGFIVVKVGVVVLRGLPGAAILLGRVFLGRIFRPLFCTPTFPFIRLGVLVLG